MRLPFLPLLAAVVVAVTACGGAAATTRPAVHPPSEGPTGGGGELATALPSRSDTVVTLSVTTYAAGGPCAGLAATTSEVTAPPACDQTWGRFSESVVPGADLMAQVPHTASLAPGVPRAEGTALATAVARWTGFQYFATRYSAADILLALDPNAARDPMVQAFQNGYQATAVPACVLPTSLRVVPMTPALSAYFATQGSSTPPPLAVVVSYAPCAGVTLNGGVAQAPEATTVAYGVVIDATPATISPFGTVVYINASAPCGQVAAANAACGLPS